MHVDDLDFTAEALEEQEREEEARDLVHDERYPNEAHCLACLTYTSVDADGLCEPCNTRNSGSRAELLALLHPITNGQDAQEKN